MGLASTRYPAESKSAASRQCRHHRIALENEAGVRVELIVHEVQTHVPRPLGLGSPAI